ncbi:adenine-N(1)--methyltransferase catalytic subunit TRM61 [Spathaspora passalidarum NRRL Y-27907]|uniref:tRNA (adenine(58)-N(1))-methyltransferase catalytic subunit TRM61 n=1 Tax=Spathaspora passalidarum (strain NRRL Y-27907 / 11-Y1) TaxID=619300 RepID=G3AJ63_SPAPN|nr:adenine-N(1)--methyltransferase catalytic subunit TRM61 [Spathaspora passalidarum NRRL Y-27907]EGW33820.1 adenine-N(1)--methyltransferase catalytic subunit TRM61 [Spathaspora passalidarum NRRL Y-27907]
MSFYAYKDIIEAGDLVLAFISRGATKPITVTPGEVLNTRYGQFEHDLMIGMKYGSQMAGKKGYGFIHLLHPTPELWTLSLPHRTQIVYTPDSSYIVQRLGVGPGSRIIEAGTGSASFTHSFARSVGDKGKVFTYEFHEVRYNEAKRELEEHGLMKNTVITHRNVCDDGFEIDNHKVDGDVVFLDLPSPWTAIPHLNKVIAEDRQVGICCFSPCIEQVEKTVKALEDDGWTSIEMVEVAGKRWEARKDMVKHVDDVVKRLKDIQDRKSQGIEKLRNVNSTAPSEVSSTESTPEPPSKKQKRDRGFNPFGKGTRIKEGDDQYEWRDVTKVESEIKSHTSYLTFAYKNPNRKV